MFIELVMKFSSIVSQVKRMLCECHSRFLRLKYRCNFVILEINIYNFVEKKTGELLEFLNNFYFAQFYFFF